MHAKQKRAYYAHQLFTVVEENRFFRLKLLITESEATIHNLQYFLNIQIYLWHINLEENVNVEASAWPRQSVIAYGETVIMLNCAQFWNTRTFPS